MIDLSLWKYSKGHSIWLIQIQRMEASLRMSFFAKCPLGSQNYCIIEDGSCYDFITHIFSRWPEVDEKLFPLALILFGFDPESKIQRESRRTWEEDLESREATLPAQPLHNFLSSRNSILKHLVAYLEFWHPEILKSWDPAHQRETHLEDVQGEGGCGGS